MIKIPLVILPRFIGEELRAGSFFNIKSVNIRLISVNPRSNSFFLYTNQELNMLYLHL